MKGVAAIVACMAMPAGCAGNTAFNSEWKDPAWTAPPMRAEGSYLHLVRSELVTVSFDRYVLPTNPET
jgi:hypothetical protein